jgi:hypothetical protein
LNGGTIFLGHKGLPIGCGMTKNLERMGKVVFKRESILKEEQEELFISIYPIIKELKKTDQTVIKTRMIGFQMMISSLGKGFKCLTQDAFITP